MNATVRPFELGLVSPLATARGTIGTRKGFLFDVTDDPRGLGEGAPLQPFTESSSACHATLRQAAAALEHDGWEGALREVSVTDDDGELRYPAARHAVALAYLEWGAKTQDSPLFRHLGGSDARDTVPVNATLGDAPVQETVDQGLDAAADGFPAIKVKVGNRSVEEDVERIRALAEAVGSGVDLRVDANGAWSVAEAETFIQETDELGLDYVEQPLDPDDIEGHAALQELGVDIALDESLALLGVDPILAAEAAAVFVIKPMAVGGIDVARGIAMQVRQAGARAVISTTIDSVVARTAAVHLAASLPDIPPSGLATGGFLSRDLADDPAPVTNGEIRLPDWPGLGIREVDL